MIEFYFIFTRIHQIAFFFETSFQFVDEFTQIIFKFILKLL